MPTPSASTIEQSATDHSRLGANVNQESGESPPPGAVLVLLLIGGFFWWRRRKRKAKAAAKLSEALEERLTAIEKRLGQQGESLAQLALELVDQEGAAA